MILRSKPFKDFGIIGGGSWATALAVQICKAGGRATLYVRSSEQAEEINQHHQNKKYLGELILPSTLKAELNLKLLKKHQMLIIAVPSLYFNEAIATIRRISIDGMVPIAIATKGIDEEGMLLSERLSLSLPNPVVIFSGPNFAIEVAKGLTTAMDVACSNRETADKIAQSITSSTFFAKAIDDIVTPQITGAIKNVIAILGGILRGLNYGDNARAILFCQGLKETMALSIEAGGKLSNIFLASAIGDMNLTYNSLNSRNTKFGYELAKSSDPHNYLKRFDYTVEGINAAFALKKLANKYKIQLSMVNALLAILKGSNAFEAEMQEILRYR